MNSKLVRAGAVAVLVVAGAIIGGDATSSAASAAVRRPTTLRLVVAPTGNEARYRVREQLVNLDLPNDAIGKTTGVTGSLTITDGKVVPAESQFVIDVSQLKSDRDFRDRYVHRRLLVTDSFPNVTFAPTEIRGAPASPRAGQSYTMQVLGNMVVRGVSHPTVWHVTASSQGAGVTGNAWTAFTFADFGITKPSVPVLLSVADTIRLEYDFNLVPKS